MTTQPVNAQKLMSEAKFYESYARYLHDKGRYETWEEAVSRVMAMHRGHYKTALEGSQRLQELLDRAQKNYAEKRALGAQRTLQFGGEQSLNHQIRNFNCTSSWVDRPAFFGECMYMLLCGAGAGFSVQHHHTDQLPDIAPRGDDLVTFKIPDSIEGWAQAIDVLLSSYFTDNQKHPEYHQKRVVFDFTEIRPKGAFISGGFKAPGPDPLRRALEHIEKLIETHLQTGARRLRPIHAYDITMFVADAVIAGGVRRSATICLFSFDDEEMMAAKTGNWFIDNPQRGRSNNSAVCVRDTITHGEFMRLMENVQSFGEPGFVFTDNPNHAYNPCVEIGMYPQTLDGRSGWQGCNLSEINGRLCHTPEDFYLACETAAVLGTLQAGYTDFKFLSKATEEIFEHEALIGVSVTGWMNNPDVLFDEAVMRQGAEIVKAVNKEVAELIGINQAARTCCAKPAGNASVLLGCASGIHGEHAPRYIRNVQMNKDTEIARLFKEKNPKMVEESMWSASGTDQVVSFPIEAEEGSIYKSDLYGVKQLEYVKKAQQVWVEVGTNVELCVDPSLRHNISNTISVDNWEEVGEYLYANRQWFAGVSLLSAMGDRDYAQAPFTAVLTAEEIMAQYGQASLFASGLIVEGVAAFGHLWPACDAAQAWAKPQPEGHEYLHKRDFVRRLNKFAESYFDGNLNKATYCLKDVHNLHRWCRIQREIKGINWTEELHNEVYTDVDTLAAQACAGGACEIF